jgi:putative drug exporter of the RND superfamily
VTVSSPPPAPSAPAQPASRNVVVRVLRRPLTWAILVLLAWTVVWGLGGQTTSKLQDVQKNDNAAWLPASAESTQVNDLQQKFSQTETFPLFVLATADGGGTVGADDLAALQQLAQQVPSMRLVDENGKAEPDGRTIGDYLTPPPPSVVPSADGKAAFVNMSVDGHKIQTPLSNHVSPIVAIVTTLRYNDQQLPSHLTTYVTGVGGIFADEFKVFGTLDTKLLGITALVVMIILILVYRSPALWFVPLLSALMALTAGSGIVYVLAKNDVLTLNGQSQAILIVLTFGAATDYALLLVARYREELHTHDSHFDAMKTAWRRVLEPITASAATVCIGLLCLLFSELNANKSTGPVAAIGIVCAWAATLTVLPALLVIPAVAVTALLGAVAFVVLAIAGQPAVGGLLALLIVVVVAVSGVLRARGQHPGWAPWTSWPKARWVFWPRIPRDGSPDEKLTGLWSRVASFIGRRARVSWVLTTLVLLVAAFFATTLKADGLSIANGFITTPESVTGQAVLAEHFPAGSGNPAIIIANADKIQQVSVAAQNSVGVDQVVPFTGEQGPPQPGAQPKVVDGLAQLEATLTAPADSAEAQAAIRALRQSVHAVPGADAKVGGFTAVQYDTQQSSQRDRRVIIPIVLVVILLILMLLLRAVVAPVLLVGTVVLSFFATLGTCALVFNHVFHFAGADSSFPLFCFTFLVALGVDYNIFLMTRVREESKRIGTHRGILKGLTVTGGVITSAGLVLAATFSVLATLPLVFLAELGFAVAFGVLLDTLVVRTFLVPALTYDVGRPIWWPSRLARVAEPAAEPDEVPAGVG